MNSKTPPSFLSRIAIAIGSFFAILGNGRLAADVSRLRDGEPLAWTLRRFERDLLEALGFGFDLAHGSDGEPVDPAARYDLDPQEGPRRLLSERGTDPRRGTATGSALLALADDRQPDPDDLASLRRGGRPLMVFLGVVLGFIVLQNITGLLLASAFGQSPFYGLLAGSVALSGGHGTGIAWGAVFAEQHGAVHLSRQTHRLHLRQGLRVQCVQFVQDQFKGLPPISG